MHPQPETYWGHVNPIGPRGVYDEAKRYAEALTMAYHNQQGVNTAIARIFNTYGPRMRQNDGRATVTFLHQALEGKPLTVFGDGSQTRSLCYVDDLIRGLYLLATSDEHLPVNIGNPDHEVTMLELAADRASRSPGSSSEIVFEALPVDDPRERRPDITQGAARSSAGSPRSTSRKACGAGSARSAGSRSRPDAAPGVLLVAVVVAALAARGARSPRRLRATCRSGSSTRRQLRYGPTGDTVASSQKLHVQVARLDLYWGGPLGVARRRPAHPGEPRRPRLRLVDLRPDRAAARTPPASQPLFAIFGTPSWANGGEGLNVAPRERARPARRSPTPPPSRYSGTYVERRREAAGRARLARLERAEQPGLPQAAVSRASGSHWVIASAQAYAQICNAIYNGVHAAGTAAERVACGATAPRGNNEPEQLAAVGLAARVPARGEDGRPAARSTPGRTTRTTRTRRRRRRRAIGERAARSSSATSTR